MIGQRTIHIRKSTNDTKRATLAVTVTASGLFLKPLLVFKGQPDGRIVKREFPQFDKAIIYACQANAWMDERVMLMWIDKVEQQVVQVEHQEVQVQVQEEDSNSVFVSV